MRISSNMFSAQMLSVFRDLQQRQYNAQAQLASGNRMLRASDDPVAARQLTMIDMQSRELDDYNANIEGLGNRLERAEAYLDGIDKAITSAHSLLLWAMDGGTAPSDVNAMRQQLAGLRDSILSDANLRDDDGHYVFSGTAVNRPTVVSDPQAPAGRRYSFGGNTQRQHTVVGHGILADSNTSLDELAGLLNKMDVALQVISTPGVSMNDAATRRRVSDCADALTVALTSVSAKQGTLGATRNRLSGLEDSHKQVGLANGEAIEQIDGLNQADAMVRQSEYMAALKASMQIYGKVSTLSLFSVL